MLAELQIELARYRSAKVEAGPVLSGRVVACDGGLVEVADGLLHRESLDLLSSDLCRRTCHKLVFAAGEALGAKAGVDTLEAAGLPVWGVSGLVTASELARREASAATGIRVLTRAALESADIREIFA